MADRAQSMNNWQFRDFQTDSNKHRYDTYNNPNCRRQNHHESRAREKGADAVVGIDIDYEVLGPNGGMLMVQHTPTCVNASVTDFFLLRMQCG